MMNAPGGGQATAYGPTRRATEETRTLKYSAAGPSLDVQQRKEDAYRQMYAAWNKKYEIMNEELIDDGVGVLDTATPIPYVGGTVASEAAQPLSAWVIRFRCLGDPRSSAVDPADKSIAAQIQRCRERGGIFVLFSNKCEDRTN